MASVLLNKVINNEINVEDVIKWLIDEKANFNFECNRMDFLTYFLNFIHEELPSKKFNCNPPPKLQEESQQKVLSTPKSSKNPSEYYCSPISPLYTDPNTSFTSQRTALCLGDFIITKSRKKGTESDEKNSKLKRINPTRVKLSTNFSKNENSFNFQNNENAEIHIDNVKETRNLLVSEKSKILPRKVENLNRNVQNVEIVADLKLVSYHKKIENVVSVYVNILKNHLVNVTSELGFLISLLVQKQFISNDDLATKLNNDLFGTIHNVIYFTVKCLEHLTEFLSYYDNVTIRMLLQHERVTQFSLSLTNRLKKIVDTKPERCLNMNDSNDEMVCFNLETDNRENFTTNDSFQAFRKQRDLFYDILRLWENNYMLDGWSFTSLNGKIRSLLLINNSPINYMHLARLFKANLINSCNKKQNLLNDYEIPFGNIDANKLNKLNNRLITKQSTNLLLFNEQQSFFKDFIVIANDPKFNKHLIDIFISDIIDLNNNFNIDLVTKQAFINCIKSLRVLAKFLGFLECMPYKMEQNCSENVIETQLKLRENIRPQFDIENILLNAIKNGNLILTIPWLVKYLSMLDFITLRLSYYKNVSHILFSLSRFHHLTNYNSALILFSLGWLFELSHYPDSDYYRNTFQFEFNNKNICLDKMNIIDEDLLYICCPFLNDLKRLLTNSTVNSKNVTVKHITPTTALQSPTELAKRKLEIQLENAFFNGQPISVRKTIEFVSERIASSCVKHVCYTIIPDFKKTKLVELHELLLKEQQLDDSNAKSFSTRYANDCVKDLKELCDKNVDKIIEETIPTTIQCLLSVDVLKQTQNICISLCKKMCLERINQWITSHVNISLFIKEFESEIYKFVNNSDEDKQKFVFSLPPSGNNLKHNDKSLSASHLLDKIKTLCVNLMENNIFLEEDVLVCILNEAKVTLTERSDVNECIKSCICNLFVDFALLLIVHRFCFIEQPNIFQGFKQIWICYPSKTTNDLFKSLLCSRNILIFAQSTNVEKSWQVFAHFIANLIKNHLLSCDCFEEQCVAIFKREWDPITLKLITMFFKQFLTHYKVNGGDYNKFAYLLDFLGNFCVDL